MVKLDKITYNAGQYFKGLLQYLEHAEISHADLLSPVGIWQLYHCKDEFLCKLSCEQRRRNQTVVLCKLGENELFLKHVTNLIIWCAVSSTVDLMVLLCNSSALTWRLIKFLGITEYLSFWGCIKTIWNNGIDVNLLSFLLKKKKLFENILKISLSRIIRCFRKKIYSRVLDLDNNSVWFWVIDKIHLHFIFTWLPALSVNRGVKKLPFYFDRAAALKLAEKFGI